MCRLSAAFLCVVLLSFVAPSDAVMGSMLGGSITWRLDDLFEENRIIHFRIETAFDKSDGLSENTGTILELYQPATGPGFDWADKFGLVKVEALVPGGDSVVEEFENKFTITFLDGDLVQGELTFPFVMPAGSTYASAIITQKSGASVITGINAIGGLPDCNPIGQSQTPCSLNAQSDVFITTNPIITLTTTVTVPEASTVSVQRGNRILNRHSPRVRAPMVQIVTEEDSGLGVPSYDLDGEGLRVYTYGSSNIAPGALDVVCERDRSVALTQLGCSANQALNLDGKPNTLYQGTEYHFVVQEPYPKPIYGNPKFYYVLTMIASDGTNTATSLFSLNLCFSTEVVNSNDVALRPPEFVDLSSGSLVRGRPPRTVRCHYLDRCSFTLYAAHFDAATGLAPSGRSVVIEAQGPGADVNGTGTSRVFMQAQTQQTVNGSGGVAAREVLMGEASLEFQRHTQADIGRMRSVCFRVRGDASCNSPPFCVNVKVFGTPPHFVAPTPPLDLGRPLLLNETTEIAVCFGSPRSFTLAAEDADGGDLTSISTADNGTGVDGVDLFAPPYSASRTGDFQGNSTRAELTVEYLLSESTGVSVEAGTRRQAFPEDRVICSQASDASWEQYLRWGGTDTRNLLSEIKCHSVQFQGPPAFITGPGLNLSTPFGKLQGTVEERAGRVIGFVGAEVSFTLAAQDPNQRESIDILLLADPGMPNNARLRPRQCHPFTYTLQSGGGELLSSCSVASRDVTWTPLPSDGGLVRRVCGTVRDSSTLCAPPRSQDPRATSLGWYGEEHCVDVEVVPPSLTWAGDMLPTWNTQQGRMQFPTVTGHVGCDLEIILRAEDTAVGNSTNGSVIISPYQVRIRQEGPASAEASLVELQTGREAAAAVHVTVPRGTEGHTIELCVVTTHPPPPRVFGQLSRSQVAEEVGGAAALGIACAVVAVARCQYCAGADDTLESVMRSYGEDSNWLRLWAANGNDDGDDATQTVTHPAQLAESTAGAPRVLHVGSIYTAQQGDALAPLASLFHTTVKTLLSLNPDVTEPAGLAEGQELCVIPCSDYSNPTWDYGRAY